MIDKCIMYEYDVYKVAEWFQNISNNWRKDSE